MCLHADFKVTCHNQRYSGFQIISYRSCILSSFSTLKAVIKGLLLTSCLGEFDCAVTLLILLFTLFALTALFEGKCRSGIEYKCKLFLFRDIVIIFLPNM